MARVRPPCPALWQTPVIRWDGELHVCCADVRGEIEVGNLQHHSFKELWESARLTQYRLWHILGEFDKMPVCGQCGGINWYSLAPEEIAAYLKAIGREDLIPVCRRRLGLNEAD